MNNNNQKVSVIVTTYQRPVSVVLRSLRSICNQTYRNIEIIIIDDSPDTYAERKTVQKAIFKLNDERIIYRQNEKNIGACASRNRGIMLSQGAYIIYVDDDDELLSDCIEKRLSKFTSSKIGLVYSDSFVINEITGEKKRTHQLKNKGMVFDKLILHNFVYAFPIMRRECFDNCGLFDVTMPAAQDYEMWLRISEKYEFEYVDEPLAIVHIHEGVRISTNYKNKIIGLKAINDKYSDYLRKHRDVWHVRELVLSEFYALNHDTALWIKSYFVGALKKPLDLKYNIKMFLKGLKGLLS